MPALGDINALLASGSPPAAVLCGLRHILAEQMGLEVPPGPAGVALLLRHLLRLRPGPFTPVLAGITGYPVRVETIPGTERGRRLTAAEAAQLAVPDSAGLDCWERGGLLIAGTTIAAEARLVIVPCLLGDDEALALIRKGVPCGQVLPGLTRYWRASAACWPADPAVTSSAALLAEGRPFGRAAERVTAAAVTRLAELAA